MMQGLHFLSCVGMQHIAHELLLQKCSLHDLVIVGDQSLAWTHEHFFCPLSTINIFQVQFFFFFFLSPGLLENRHHLYFIFIFGLIIAIIH